MADAEAEVIAAGRNERGNIWFDVELPAELADELERIMAAPPGSIGKLNFETPRVPTVPASALRDTLKG